MTAHDKGRDQARLDASRAEGADPRRRFAEPLEVVEADGRYEDRLAVLHRWRSLAADEGDAAAWRAVEGSLLALEQGAALGQDPPEGAPRAWGYPAPKA